MIRPWLSHITNRKLASYSGGKHNEAWWMDIC